VRLKPKQDVLTDDPMSFFAVDSTTLYAVSIRPFIQGLPSMSKPWRQGPFRGRRLTAINVSPTLLFRLAYEVSPCRVQNQLPDSLRRYDDLSRVCFDLIVSPGQTPSQLLATMREELSRYSAVRASWVTVRQPVYVLRRRAGTPPLVASTKPPTSSSSGGEFMMQGSPLEPLRDYLENELGKPVMDETGLTGKYDVAFPVESENLKPSLTAALSQRGLELQEDTRDVQVLRLTAAPASAAARK